MKSFKAYRVMLVLLLAAQTSWCQNNPTPAPPQTKSILIMNGKAHIGNGEVIENSVIGLKDGKLTIVADARVVRINMSEYDTVIYADGKEIYPGFIAPNSILGLHEVDAVRATRDENEVGTFKPGIRSLIAYNTDSEVIPTVRSNGVLMGQPTPRGGVISGTSCIVQFDAWNWEDAVIQEDDGVHLNWPLVFHRHYDKGKVNIEKVKTYDQQKQEIISFFNEARAYCNVKNPALTEIRFEAMRGIFDGSKVLYVHADDVKSITEAINFKREFSISKMVIVGGTDAHLVAPMLVENNVPVMIKRLHSNPEFEQDDVDLPYKLPKLLQDAGVLFCLENSGSMEHHGVRNLPFYAGTAVAYGLTYEQAVASISLNTAKILGIDDQCGSLEPGKDATLFISDGDALDMKTNHLIAAFIQGRQIDLSSKQTELYEKYREKYGRE